MVLFLSIAASVIIFALIYRGYIDRFSAGRITCAAEIDRGEVFEGEYFNLLITVKNTSLFPVSAVRVDINLPDGLEYCPDIGDKALSCQPYISGIYTLKSLETASRTCRLSARRRGVYTVDRALIVKRPIFGFDKQSERIELERTASNTVAVYPEIIDLREYFTTSQLVTGNALSRARLVRDPLMINGVREYTPDDPMNRVNWKVSAVHGSLFVNNEEFSEKYELDVLLNMQSRSRERDMNSLAYPENVDLCVNVCAAIIDKCERGGIPLSVITNGKSDAEAELCGESRDGGVFSVTETASEKDGYLRLQRFLCGLENTFTAPTYDMLEEIAAAPHRYLNGRNLVIVTAYLDSFILKFHNAVTAQGISVVYYVTAAQDFSPGFAPDAEIHYKTRKTEAAYE